MIYMKFGADNLFKRLRSVLLAKPINYAVDKPINMWQEKNIDHIDFELAARQHGDMARALEGLGVEVHFLDPVKGATEQKDTRDLGIFSQEGAIAGHFKNQIRMGEVAAFIKFCSENDISLLKYGVPFEGGDFFFYDNEQCIIGVGRRTEVRTNEIEGMLKRKVVLIHHIADHHLDAIFNIVSRDLMVVHPGYVAEEEFFKGKNILKLEDEDIWNMSANFLLIEENVVLADVGCKDFNDRLRSMGVEVHEIDVSELKKNGGSIRCMTVEILRD